MTRDVDSLTSATLKNLRERWWDAAFTAFLKDTLQPKAGQRILDVGCGVGTAEVQLSRLRLSQVQMIGVDLLASRVAQARAAAQSHNIRAQFSGADACMLPFTDGAFDSAFCIAVLQHINDVPTAVRELARVTRPEGRIVAVEPDNAGRYFYSSLDVGMRAYESAGLFFASMARSGGDSTGADPSVGPKLPTLFAQNGIEPLSVHLFPVSRAQLGAPSEAMWQVRRSGVLAQIDKAPDESIRRLGQDYMKMLDRYATGASAAGSAFVEIQNTMLFATVGQRAEP